MRHLRALIIAGPNGSGKTTFAREFLVGEWACETFVNADLIAAGFAPFRPADAAAKAMRLMAEVMHACVKDRKDFAIESTLAGRSYIGLIREWQEIGYLVKIVYLRLASVEVAVKRVRTRVAQGGHDVQNEVVRRRFERGWENFQRIYRPLADVWQVYDANGSRPLLVDEGERK